MLVSPPEPYVGIQDLLVGSLLMLSRRTTAISLPRGSISSLLALCSTALSSFNRSVLSLPVLTSMESGSSGCGTSVKVLLTK